MSGALEQILREALRLGEEERAALAAELLASLEPNVPAEGRGEAEWLEEIERRARAALEGRLGIPWPEARAGIEDRLRRR
jgi:hypothetical protein